MVGSQNQVTIVFTVFLVHQDHYFAGSHVGDYVLDR